MKKLKKSILASFITISVLAILLTLGPVQALILELSVSDSSPLMGDIISFIVSIIIEADEKIPIDKLTLNITGPDDLVCDFLPNGTLISSCPGVEITQLSSTDFEFGYGFTEGIMSYNITLDTSEFDIGDYMSNLIVTANGDQFVQVGEDLVISSLIPNGCSVRGKNGELDTDIGLFTRNKVNFNVPNKRARDGRGHLTSQEGRDRFRYKFDVVGMLENTKNKAVYQTKGQLTLGKVKSNTSATITLDKKNGIIKASSPDFDLDDMDLTFLKGC